MTSNLPKHLFLLIILFFVTIAAKTATINVSSSSALNSALSSALHNKLLGFMIGFTLFRLTSPAHSFLV
jgi:hypothetical protein